MNTADLFQKITHFRCQMCKTSAPMNHLHIEVNSLDDIEDDLTYDVWAEIVDCCGDPFLEAFVITTEPMMQDEAFDNDARVTVGGETRYEYVINEDFIADAHQDGLLR